VISCTVITRILTSSQIFGIALHQPQEIIFKYFLFSGRLQKSLFKKMLLFWNSLLLELHTENISITFYYEIRSGDNYDPLTNFSNNINYGKTFESRVYCVIIIIIKSYKTQKPISIFLFCTAIEKIFLREFWRCKNTNNNIHLKIYIYIWYNVLCLNKVLYLSKSI